MVKILLLQGLGRQAVYLLEGPVHGVGHARHRQTGAQLPQIHHPGRHGGHALAGDLGLGRAEIAAHFGHVRVDEQGAVVEGAAAMIVEGVAGEFPALGQQVIAAGQLRLDAQQTAGLQDHPLLAGQVIIPGGHGEGEVQIPHVVEHCTAAGQTAGQGASLLLQQAGAALLPGVLVAADDHGVLVLPQVEDAGVVRHMLRQVLLQGQVAIGIGSVAGIGIQVLDHGFLQRRIGCRAAFTSSGRPMGIWWGASCMASGSS